MVCGRSLTNIYLNAYVIRKIQHSLDSTMICSVRPAHRKLYKSSKSYGVAHHGSPPGKATQFVWLIFHLLPLDYRATDLRLLVSEVLYCSTMIREFWHLESHSITLFKMARYPLDIVFIGPSPTQVWIVCDLGSLYARRAVEALI